MTAPRGLAEAIAGLTGASPARLSPVSGGDINQAFRAELSDGRTVFVKHHAQAPAGMFAAEAAGLRWLAEPGALPVPAVIGHGDALLVLAWLAPAPRGPGFAEALGRGLAQVHRAGAPRFGHDQPSFIGPLPQDNTPCDDVVALWVERRLRPMAERAIARGRGPARWRDALDLLGERMGALVPEEPPARLHGDLWSGNVHATAHGPALIDPAVYGGPREVDLAMLDLFGGLAEATVDAYDEAWPLADDWRARLPLWQLYPLLVHAVLFGGSYPAAVDAALARYL